MNTVNRDYAFFKVTYFDFPMNDSLYKLAGESINIRYVIDVWLAQPLGERLIVETMTDDNHPVTESLYFNAKFHTKGIKNIEHVASQVRKHLLELQSWVPIHPIPNNEGNVQVGSGLPLRRFFNWYTDIVYDGDTHKLAFELNRPQEFYSHASDAGKTIARMRMTIIGEGTSRGDELLMLMLGGEKNLGGWYSTFDTGFTNFFQNAKNSAAAFVDNLSNCYRVDQLLVYSVNIPRVFVDPFVYIRGTPETSVWSTNGTTNNLVTIQPRNKISGMTAMQSAFITD